MKRNRVRLKRKIINMFESFYFNIWNRNNKGRKRKLNIAAGLLYSVASITMFYKLNEEPTTPPTPTQEAPKE